MINKPFNFRAHLNDLIEQAKATGSNDGQEKQAVAFMRQLHKKRCFEVGDRHDENDTPYSMAANALDAVGPLRARLADAEAMAEAAERFRLFLSDHPSPAVTYLVTSAGNDAWADFCAALEKWRAGK